MSISERALTCLSSAGCHLPGRQVPMARRIREEAIAALWPSVANDPFAVIALVLACNAHSEARWWVVHEREVVSLITTEVARLLTLRERAIEQQAMSTSLQ